MHIRLVPNPRAACALPLLAALAVLAGCGGGGGGQAAFDRFPASAPTELAAAVVDLESGDGDSTLQLAVMDVVGRGSAVLTNFVDPTNPGVVPDVLLWSPDHTLLAFVAFPDGGENRHLFVVDPKHGLPIDVAGAFLEQLDAGVNAPSVRWSPDGSRLAFTAAEDVTSVSHIVLVDPDGSNLVDLLAADPLGIASMEGVPAWAPDSSRVAVEARFPGTVGERLVTVRKDGTDFVDVTASPTPVAGAEIMFPEWNPQSTLVLFQGTLEVATREDVYVAGGIGGVDVLRVSPGTGGGNVTAAHWSPDGSRFAYTANLVTAIELFSAEPRGTGFFKVSGPMVAGGSVRDFHWSPTGARLSFVADRLVSDQFELFTATPTGASLVRVSVPLDARGDVELTPGLLTEVFSPWSPDGARLTYRADAVLDGTLNAFVVDADGTDSHPLTDVIPAGSVRGVLWNPDSRFLMLDGDVDVDGAINVFIADADAPTAPPVPVTFGTGFGSRAIRLDWSADGSRAVYFQEVGELDIARSALRNATDVRDLVGAVDALQTVVTR